MLKKIVVSLLFILGAIFLSLLIPVDPSVYKNDEQFTTRFMLGGGGEFPPSAQPFSSWLDLENISPALICSVIKAEDRTFFSHTGFDLPSIHRALIKRMQDQRLLGASTITQQLAKNLLGNRNRTWANKLKEAWYTARLEVHLSKKQILEYYLNSIEWGINIWGVKQASQNYFHKEPDKLTLSESLYLASIIANPRDLESDQQIARMNSVYERVSYQLNVSELINNEELQMVRNNLISSLTNNDLTILATTTTSPNKSFAFPVKQILETECGLAKELINGNH